MTDIDAEPNYAVDVVIDEPAVKDILNEDLIS